MNRPWKFNLIVTLGIVGIAIYFLIPSVSYFMLNEEQLKEVRRSKDAFAKYKPDFAPDTHIVPGLDLQGGIRMVLGVDLERAISDKTSRAADRLRMMATDDKVPFSKITYEKTSSGDDIVTVTFENASDLDVFNEKVLKKFGDLVTDSTGNNSFTLKLHSNLVQSIKTDAVDQTITTIRNRVDKMGVAEPSISRQGIDQVQIQLPGFDDPDAAKSMIGRTARLEFQMNDDETDFLTKLTDLPKDVTLQRSYYSKPDNSSANDIYLRLPESMMESVKAYLSTKLPDGLTIKFGKEREAGFVRTYTVQTKVELSGEDLVDTRVIPGTETDPRPFVSISFSPTGAVIFDKLTAASVGKRMAIVLEDWVDSAPVINQRISGGSATITMGGMRTREETMRDANQLALVLKSGSLPAPVTFREERIVGPSLGADAVQNGLNAFLLGSSLVALFMIFYYRVSGFISIIAVACHVLFVLAMLSGLSATLTLPGLAGLLLTVGMGVDTNVIINERIREELRAGKMPRSAVDAGYAAALSAVLDTHITTFISGIVLWEFGTGPVQNFATTIIMGSVSSVFAGIFITRIFFDMWTARGVKTLSI